MKNNDQSIVAGLEKNRKGNRTRDKHIQWNGTLSQEGYDILKGSEGGCIVCPTKSWLHHHEDGLNVKLKPKNVTATNQV